ncbi:D-mannonate dehydratase ManD [Agromyces marinus]|uniref:D-mannonate dehydratase ManD n=1 Tax=Agromyces marinus TaxID=1389020 RepID=UPI001F3BAF48|nr:D-mannonate dehydratase ManD [Agromyces marinus]UIP59224.1 D-mannonate dehydratase [Agromyces marinus]
MNITQVKVIVTNPGRNFVTAKIETSEGISGVGDATLNGRELAVATYLSEHVAPMLIGRDAFAIEDTWQLMSRASYWRRGPVQTAAQSAIDMALWDIKGKALGVPVYQLLGGRCRTGVMAYTHAGAAEISETIDDLQMFIEQGYHAVRLQCGVPGVPDVYGVDRDTSTQPGAGTERPYVEGWDTSAYLGVVPKLFEAAREAVGFGTHLLHDVHHRLTPSEAGWLGKRLEDHRLFWLEDALASDYQSAYRLVRQHTTTPLAVGEVFTSLVDCEQLIREQLIDYVRASAVHAGGLTGLRKIAAFAEPYQVKTGCHGAADMSPITMAAALHFGVSTHNVGIQERALHPEEADDVFPHAYTFSDGYLDPGEAPGLGVDIDEALAERYEYRRGYLPVVRLRDGTLTNW